MLFDAQPVDFQQPKTVAPESTAPSRRFQASRPELPRKGAYADVAADVEAKSDGTAAPTVKSKTGTSSFKLWENGSFGFGDIVDTINPLQHIPIVATIYRNMTGDKIGAVPRIIGGALWFRLGGLITGLVNAVVDYMTGKDIGDHIFSALFNGTGRADKETATAQAPVPASTIVDDSGASTGNAVVPLVESAPNPRLSSAVTTSQIEREPTTGLSLALQQSVVAHALTAFKSYQEIERWHWRDTLLHPRLSA